MAGSPGSRRQASKEASISSSRIQRAEPCWYWPTAMGVWMSSRQDWTGRGGNWSGRTSPPKSGQTLHGIQINISYENTRTRKKVRKPPEKWLGIENTHEAIISKGVFKQLQEQIANRCGKIQDAPTARIFSGLAKYAECGWSMGFDTN